MSEDNLNQLYPKAYGRWAGRPGGIAPDYTRCCKGVVSREGGWAHEYQCTRKRGYGPDGALVPATTPNYGWQTDMTRLPAAITLLFKEAPDQDGMEVVRLGLSDDAGEAVAWSFLPDVVTVPATPMQNLHDAPVEVKPVGWADDNAMRKLALGSPTVIDAAPDSQHGVTHPLYPTSALIAERARAEEAERELAAAQALIRVQKQKLDALISGDTSDVAHSYARRLNAAEAREARLREALDLQLLLAEHHKDKTRAENIGTRQGAPAQGQGVQAPRVPQLRDQPQWEIPQAHGWRRRPALHRRTDMSDPYAFGWAVRSEAGSVMLPVFSTRVEVIRFVVHSFDSELGNRSRGKRLLPHEWRAWRHYKRNYQMQAVRVRVQLAFQQQEPI